MKTKIYIINICLFALLLLLSACPRNQNHTLPLEINSPSPEATAAPPQESDLPETPDEVENNETISLTWKRWPINEIFSLTLLTGMPVDEIIYRADRMSEDEEKSIRNALSSVPFDDLSPNEKFLAAYIKYRDLLVKRSSESQPQAPINYTQYSFNQEVEIDLNGDGVPDKILVAPIHIYRVADGVKVTVNGVEWDSTETMYLGNLKDGFAVVDIDKSDKFKEIVISNIGPSGESASIFLCYDGEKIIYMNEEASTDRPISDSLEDYRVKLIGGDYSHIEFPGNGEIVANQQASILQTWFYPLRYKLTEGHLLKVIPEIFNVDYPVIVLTDFPLYADRDEESPVITLEKGTIVTLTALDDIEWVQATLPDGRSGWFKVISHNVLKIGNKRIRATDVFHYLSGAG